MDRVFTDQEQVRRAKLARLVQEGKDPFAIVKVGRTHVSSAFASQYADQDRDALAANKDKIVLAGRIVAIRQMFCLIQDQFGKTQLYLNKDHASPAMVAAWKDLDLGDFIDAEGSPMRTKTGELTLNVHCFRLISKSLRVLPDKFHGLTDVEERARRRYVDLIVSEKSRDVFLARSKILTVIRAYMAELGYIEVETPILHDVLGGAAARPFVTHHNALDRDYYLRIATELPLKRCLVGGLDKVYEMGRIFRNEGMDATHNPEFTTLEAYAAYQNMEDMMALVENMIRRICRDLKVGAVTVGDQTIELDKPFAKKHMVDLVKEHSGEDFWKVHDPKQAVVLAKKHGIHLQKHQHTVGHIINLFFEHFCEKHCLQPIFVYGHPVEISPLAKKSSDPRFTERFELFIAGKEYANAFSELNDPIDQYERFLEQTKLKELGDDEANEMDLDFVEALEYGMPPAGGIGIGIDRVVMLLTGTSTIRDVLLFPHMRRRSEHDKEE